MKFDGKLVLITGAATGIGRATARSLGQLGARVVIVDINEDGAKEAAKSVPGGKAVAFRCNLANDQEVADLQRQVESSCGVVDILINNAAKPPVTGSILNVGLDQFQAAFDVNVLGYLRTIKAFLPGMLERNAGHIVNTSSALALLPDPPIRFMGPYITSKGAQLSLSYAYAHALSGTGVGISVFCPGITATAEMPGGVPPSPPPGMPAPEEFSIGVPTRRTVRVPAEHAAKVLIEGLERDAFLICSQSNYQPDLIAFASAGYDPASIVGEALGEAKRSLGA
ncbi:SDR family NAD(P)-dependent oxidoreductase [Agrobacterium vitis]|uniref:Oxidoreductase n=2 Tax=Rhizobium/Agrobacterium group TaxID=227290 RepID=B9K5C4_ALLAM|nr:MULTISPECIES: SDR family oxidoreductase [Rhizobium/Agrobacterium group]ACM40072.1 oxidoreductase [Allorhizobium ampelinum S4]MCF1450210.1 SDR family oxidoreductase [Allorhizobium ampelinum]MUO28452.1 SDR family NAD(P)-dependent oxidoreductase [Agrobacterium vitis]MUO41334.1 SDR family NAD(P)-dependent oxidoreductase [Agrobacterium vitis]MUO88974.1 SDR family NAD(P)-dependent oxidoreductase [Agrobacterium vitis]